LTDKLAIGAEVFHTTSSMVGRDGVTGFNVGGQYDITEPLSPALLRRPRGLLYAVDAARVTDPVTYYAAFQWTF